MTLPEPPLREDWWTDCQVVRALNDDFLLSVPGPIGDKAVRLGRSTKVAIHPDGVHLHNGPIHGIVTEPLGLVARLTEWASDNSRYD